MRALVKRRGRRSPESSTCPASLLLWGGNYQPGNSIKTLILTEFRDTILVTTEHRLGGFRFTGPTRTEKVLKVGTASGAAPSYPCGLCVFFVSFHEGRRFSSLVSFENGSGGQRSTLTSLPLWFLMEPSFI